MTKENGELVIIRPLGSQGPKIGIQVLSEEDFQRLDEAFGELSINERKTVEGIRKATREANLRIVDS